MRLLKSSKLKSQVDQESHTFKGYEALLIKMFVFQSPQVTLTEIKSIISSELWSRRMIREHAALSTVFVWIFGKSSIVRFYRARNSKLKTFSKYFERLLRMKLYFDMTQRRIESDV